MAPPDLEQYVVGAVMAMVTSLVNMTMLAEIARMDVAADFGVTLLVRFGRRVLGT